jgi:nicotinamidase-related amidase
MTERRPNNIEYLKNYPLSRLIILVHPYSEGHDETYTRKADEIYRAATRIYTPINTKEFLLLMTHNSKSDDNSEQSDLLRRLRNGSMIPDNVQVIDDIVHSNRDYHSIDEELTKYGKKINRETEIIIGGERLDQCVESVARRLLKNPDILEIKISRRVSLYSDLENYAEASRYIPSIAGTRSTTQGLYFLIEKK